MKKIFTYIMMGVAMLTFSKCDSLDLEPTSSVTDANYWKNETQFEAFNTGLHALLRERSYNFFILGEPRADYYTGTISPIGSASQGLETMWFNTLSETSPQQSNYANLYVVINQLNLMIIKTAETKVLAESTKNYYLGEAYGMRAFLYFHLLRSWGDVIIHTDYTDGNTIDLGHLDKAVSPVTDVMQQIIDDIKASEDAFGSDVSFKNGKRYYWSKAATLMLKGEVYLWRGQQMNGGVSDFTTAKNALQAVQAIGFNLQPKFTDVFSFNNKNNEEIIFNFYNGRNEYNLWGDVNFINTMVPQSSTLADGCYDENGVAIINLEIGNVSGLYRYPINDDFYKKGYHDKDSRKRGTLMGVYKNIDDQLTYVGCYSCKFVGTTLAGASTRSMLDDYPIYRYADCLLLLAEAKALLGEDPSIEINTIRERAYGKEYFEANKSTLAYPNDNEDIYDNNKFMEPDKAGAIEAILKERMREFMIEGKRWYDLRLAGVDYVLKYTTADAQRLLWPIDTNTLTNNRALKQTPGYTKEDK